MKGLWIMAWALVLSSSLALPAVPARAWVLYRLAPSEVQTSSTAPGTTTACLHDADGVSAWRATSEDATPWVEYRFAEAVQPGFLMVETESASGTAAIREVTVTTDTGVSHVLTLSEYAEAPMVRWPSVGGVRSLRMAITGRDSGTVGVAELIVLGRRAADPTALTLGKLATCTLVLECDLVLPANRPATSPVGAEVFLERDGFFPWGLQMRARDVSASDRTVRAGKTFEVSEVIDTASALTLKCTDGSTFGLFVEGEGAPRSLMSVTDTLTIADLNDIFAGVVRFANPQGRELEDY